MSGFKADVTLTVTYNFVGEDTTFEIDGNCKPEFQEEIISIFLQDMVGSGTNKKEEVVNRDVYKITLLLDLDGDRFRIRHDCGNLSLAVGILMDVLRRLPKEVNAS